MSKWIAAGTTSSILTLLGRLATSTRIRICGADDNVYLPHAYSHVQLQVGDEDETKTNLSLSSWPLSTERRTADLLPTGTTPLHNFLHSLWCILIGGAGLILRIQGKHTKDALLYRRRRPRRPHRGRRSVHRSVLLRHLSRFPATVSCATLLDIDLYNQAAAMNAGRASSYLTLRSVVGVPGIVRTPANQRIPLRTSGA